jgi:imidazole glycerol-phosphate synthase subunit HisH
MVGGSKRSKLYRILLMIVIVDYGMSNIFSIKSALDYLGTDSIVSRDQNYIKNAKKLIFPGVGSFRMAMFNLKKNNLIDPLREAVLEHQVPILGICLGMQLLCTSSTEDGLTNGLGIIDCSVEKFNDSLAESVKIPHVGFDTVSIISKGKIVEGLSQKVDFYFSHSYRIRYNNQPYAVAICSHGETFIAAFEKYNICGTQFHPEKSQANGLSVLNNFVNKF